MHPLSIVDAFSIFSPAYDQKSNQIKSMNGGDNKGLFYRNIRQPRHGYPSNLPSFLRLSELMSDPIDLPTTVMHPGRDSFNVRPYNRGEQRACAGYAGVEPHLIQHTRFLLF